MGQVNQERQPTQLICEDILDQEGVDEAGHRNNNHGCGGNGIIDPAVLLQRSENTEGNTNRDTEQNGIQINNHGGRQLGNEDSQNVLTEVELIGHAPVKLRENILQKNTKLNKVGFVVALGLTAGFNNNGVGISGRQLRRGQHPDQDKAHTGDDQQDQAHVCNSL